MSEMQTVTSENTLPAPIAASIALPLVLIADADASSRLDRTRHFENRGYRVAVARTPFEAIVKASCHLPDLIVVDRSFGDSGVSETTELLATCPQRHTSRLCVSEPQFRTGPHRRGPMK